MDIVYDSKIEKLLDKLLEPYFDISEEQLCILSNHLPDLYSDQTVGLQFFRQWFKRFIKLWQTSPNKISTKAILLITDIIGLLISEEEVFLNLNFSNMIDEFWCIIRSLPEMQVIPYSQRHYIRLMVQVLKHKSGMLWLMVSNSWFDILLITAKASEGIVFQEGCRFLVDFLDKFQNNNETFNNNVIRILLSPLINFNRQLISSVNIKEEPYSSIKGSLNILEKILQEMLIRSCCKKDFKFFITLQEKFRIEIILKELISNRQLLNLQLELNRILSIVTYFMLLKNLKEPITESVDLNYFLPKIYDILQKTFTSVNRYSAVLRLLHDDYIYFKQIITSLDERKHLISDFQNQVLAFIIMPIRKASILISGKLYSGGDDLREYIVTKWLRTLLPITFLTVMKIKEKLTVHDAVVSLTHIQNSTALYDHDFITRLCQLLLLLLKDILDSLVKSPEDASHDAQELLVAMLETIMYLLTEFNLTRKYMFENICALGNIGSLLKLTQFSPRVITRGLQFFNVAVRRNLSPEMYLLLDPKERLDNIRLYFLNYLSHENWEVRNAAIQVLQAKAQTKKEYNSTREYLLKLAIPEKIVIIVISDQEITVRISALRCLCDIVKFDVLWENISAIPNFYKIIMDTFYAVSDGVFRSETIRFLAVIYEQHILPGDVIERLYSLMTYGILEDELISVKISALYFWQKVIDKRLLEEGIIDGEFPTVTFSKKLKKIITFDDNEIRTSLESILLDLSKIGCLKVYLYALSGEPDNTLEQQTLPLIKPFILLLKKYGVSVSTLNCKEKSFNDFCASKKASNRPNIISPYPEYLFDDSIDLQESLVLDSETFDEILIPDNSEVHRYEFVRFVEHFECFLKSRNNTEDVEVLLNNILK